MNREANDTVELRIPSQLRFLGLVDAIVQSFAADFPWEPDDVNNLSTAAIEAASNAMEHGNRFAQDKWVRLWIRGDRRGVEIEVEDQGKGFDPAPYERDLTPDDLLKLRGRGIFIMRAMMDRVEFDIRPGEGTLVHLTKNLRRENGGSAADPSKEA